MEQHRLEVPEKFGLDGAYVVIRARQSWSALNRVQSAGLVVRTSAAGPTGEVTADVLARGLALLDTAVMSWGGILDMHGRPIPATHAGYLHDDLESEVIDWLVDAIAEHYEAQKRPPEDSEGKAEPPHSQTPSADGNTSETRLPSPLRIDSLA